MHPYQTYKTTNINWLETVPAHWEFRKAKYIFTKMSRPIRAEDDVVTAFRDGEVTLRKNRRTEGFTLSLKEIGYQGIRNGDLVIHEMDAFAGAIGVSDSDGKSTPVYTVCVPHIPASPKYYAYLLRTMATNGFILSLAKGIRERSSSFSFNIFKDLELPYFPEWEQRAIAAFLDRKTAQIDTLIAKKQRQVELLQEHRTALINQAVTKGLNPGVEMKDSGIEWLGEVPRHWANQKLKFISHVQFSNVDKHSYDHEIPVLLCNYVDVYYNDLITDEIDFMKATANEKEIERFKLQEGDVLITKDSESWDDIAVPAYSATDFNNVLCGYHLALIRSKPNNILGKYLFWAFLSREVNDQYKVSASGVTRYGLGKYALENSLFPLPPLPEQRAIAAFLDRKTAQIDTLIAKIEKQISHYQEYRTALISAAVTGKIDVREEVEI